MRKNSDEKPELYDEGHMQKRSTQGNGYQSVTVSSVPPKGSTETITNT